MQEQLIDARVIRRHSEKCKSANRTLDGFGEDMLSAEGCNCNFGYKGKDPTTGLFRRLQFIPAIYGIGAIAQNAAHKRLFEIEQGVTPVVPPPPVASRITIEDAFEKYLGMVRLRHVAESSIYAMFRPVGNMVLRQAAKLGLRYMDELAYSFATQMLLTFSVSRREEKMTEAEKEEKRPKPISINVQGQYRTYFADFCRVAKKEEWTPVDLCEKLDKPARGHSRTKPQHPTMPFDLATELPLIMDAITNLDLGSKSRWRRSIQTTTMWRDNVATAKAFLLTLRRSGMRNGDSLKFEPRLLEPVQINGTALYRATVEQEKTGERGMTPNVTIFIPKVDAEFIMRVPRFSDEFAFIPPGIDPKASKRDEEKFKRWRNWKCATYSAIFQPLAALSGVPHVHAHRFRDTFDREIWVRIRKDGGMRALTYLSKRLGHSSVKVTMEHYMQWLEEDQIEADSEYFENGSLELPGASLQV